MLGIADQQDADFFARGQDFAELVERHRQQRAGVGRRDDGFDAEFRQRFKAPGRSAAGELHVVEPRGGFAERADHARRQPLRYR